MTEQSMSALVKEFEAAEKAEGEASRRLAEAKSRRKELAQELAKRLNLQTASSPNRTSTGRGAPKAHTTPEQAEKARRMVRDGVGKEEIKRELGIDGRVLNRLAREVSKQSD